jgi:CBS domain-containing protein
MSDANVGAVLVLDGDKLVGILSERDYARKVILHGKASRDTRVSEIMTDKVLYVTPEQTVDECMAIMTEKHFRHLPVSTTRAR